MLLHMLYDSVDIFKQYYMTKLVYLVMSDRLYLHHITDIFQVRI